MQAIPLVIKGDLFEEVWWWSVVEMFGGGGILW